MKICNDCGKKNTPWKTNAVEIMTSGATFHYGKCAICNNEKGVTDSRVYGIRDEKAKPSTKSGTR